MSFQYEKIYSTTRIVRTRIVYLYFFLWNSTKSAIEGDGEGESGPRDGGAPDVVRLLQPLHAHAPPGGRGEALQRHRRPVFPRPPEAAPGTWMMALLPQIMRTTMNLSQPLSSITRFRLSSRYERDAETTAYHYHTTNFLDQNSK